MMIDAPNVMPCDGCEKAQEWSEPDPTLPRLCENCDVDRIIRKGIGAMVAEDTDGNFFPYGNRRLKQAIADTYNRTVANGGTTLTFHGWKGALRKGREAPERTKGGAK